MTARVCETCGVTLLNPKGRRKFCSERCRKRQYDLECVECGGRVDGTTPSKIPNLDEPVCLACAAGHYAVWTRDAIVCAINEWADEHGGVPPTANDFRRARVSGETFPNVNHVRGRWGTWNAAIRAAGYEPHAGGPVGGFTRLTVEQRRECADRYAAGETSVVISADLGCAPRVVLHWARVQGVEIRAPFFTKSAA